MADSQRGSGARAMRLQDLVSRSPSGSLARRETRWTPRTADSSRVDRYVADCREHPGDERGRIQMTRPATRRESLIRRVERNGLTDTFQAECFVAKYGCNWRFDHSQGRWMTFRDFLWRPEQPGELKRFLIATARDFQQKAESIKDTKAREKALSWAKFCQGNRGWHGWRRSHDTLSQSQSIVRAGTAIRGFSARRMASSISRRGDCCGVQPRLTFRDRSAWRTTAMPLVRVGSNSSPKYSTTMPRSSDTCIGCSATCSQAPRMHNCGAQRPGAHSRRVRCDSPVQHVPTAAAAICNPRRPRDTPW